MAPLWQPAAYTLYPDSVVQGHYRARAQSATELLSNYRSPAAGPPSPRIRFKFSLNGQDNALPTGQENAFLALPAAGGEPLQTPVIAFGQRYVDERPVPAGTPLAPNTPVTFRVNLQPVLAAFKRQGYYVT